MKLKLSDTILLYMMVAIMIIGGHQTYLVAQTEGLRMGFIKSYWIYMIVMVLMAIYQIKKRKTEQEEEENGAQNSKTSKSVQNIKIKGKKKQK